MDQRIRVVHAPARTPYARKLTSEHVAIVNGTALLGEEVVPRDMSLRWLLDHRPFTWFDVLHLHHIEFDDISVLKSVLSECSRSRRRVVFTAHDVDPIFSGRIDYHRKLRTLSEGRVPFVCLTEASRTEIHRRLGTAVPTVTVPHGYVIEPNIVPHDRTTKGDHVRYFMFGALRENRDIATALYNWRFGHRQQRTSLSVLLRAPGHISMRQEQDRWALLSTMAAAEPRLRVEVMPFPSDGDVANAAAGCDALILPYRWGSHSGQLELAFDLGLVPVASAVGYLRDQYRNHVGLVDEPVWFDWSDGAEYAYGARFLTALDQAVERFQSERSPSQQVEFTEHRLKEHESIMTAYLEVYTRPLS